jgi:hypothetical protein
MLLIFSHVYPLNVNVYDFNFLLDTNMWELLQIFILNFCGPFRRGMRNLKIHN